MTTAKRITVRPFPAGIMIDPVSQVNRTWARLPFSTHMGHVSLLDEDMTEDEKLRATADNLASLASALSPVSENYRRLAKENKEMREAIRGFGLLLKLAKEAV